MSNRLGPCLCPDFKENVEKLNAPFVLAVARNPDAGGYKGKQFQFCPWCGKELLPFVVVPESETSAND